MHIGKGMLKLQQMTKWDVFLRHSVVMVVLPYIDICADGYCCQHLRIFIHQHFCISRAVLAGIIGM